MEKPGASMVGIPDIGEEDDARGRRGEMVEPLLVVAPDTAGRRRGLLVLARPRQCLWVRLQHRCYFPRLLCLHQSPAMDFFKNACHMLRPYGEVHVSHKTGARFANGTSKNLRSSVLLCWLSVLISGKKTTQAIEIKEAKAQDVTCLFLLVSASHTSLGLGRSRKGKNLAKRWNLSSKILILCMGSLFQHLHFKLVCPHFRLLRQF
ncbi:hypothetical protein Cni_G06853 [Canna indica]|uniref:Uncharacterized protein n=1 Tax=Canna indica TaxID=4628 RepID=A0AAQ3JZD6_9LILI|nr:hypothetical protein Cni_G06853 [Canna indica]